MFCLVLAWFIVGAFWRRILGGWLGLPRVVCYALSVPLSAAPVAIAAEFLDAPWWLSAVLSAVVASLALTFFIRGFTSDKIEPEHIWRKYGPFAVGYWAAWKWWPANWRVAGFIDGAGAVGELGLGGTFYATLAFVCSMIVWLA